MGQNTGSSSLSTLFTPVVLNELHDQLGHSLNDIFGIMFYYPLTPQAETAPQAGGLKAHVRLKHRDIIAYLEVQLSDIIVDDLVHKATEAYGTLDFSIGQDVACEVANIISHSIRTYLLNTQGITLIVGTPVIGQAPTQNQDQGTLTIQSSSQSNGTVTLRLLYPNAA